MWLWKKFWNIDIIGKIYILIILFILIVATITITTRYNNTSTNQVVNDQRNEINESIENTITSDLNVTDNEITSVANVKENTKPETEYQIVKSNDEKKTDTETKSKETNTIKKENIKPSSDSTAPKETIVKQTEIQEKKEEIKEITKDEQNVNIEIKEEVIEEHSTSVPKEEYKVNNEMINKMKDYILNNPSEDMKQYGFEVVVDSSIVELTNQFTYTEQRMRDQLTWRFGTIRIYALDYYCNGNLVMTECFIL